MAVLFQEEVCRSHILLASFRDEPGWTQGQHEEKKPKHDDVGQPGIERSCVV
jgi:hypothetical protein